MNYKSINNDFISQNNARILSSFNIQPRYVPEPQPDKYNNKLEKEPKKNEMNDNVKKWLWAVYTHQYRKKKTALYKLAGFSIGGTGKRAAEYCENNNLVKNIKPGFGSGSPQYPILLPEAYQILGIQEKKFYGKGAGYEHVLYQHLFAEHFSELKPVIELYRNGKHIDVAIETNEILLAIEVAMTSVNEKENIHKDFLKAMADFVLVACINDKVQKEVQEIILEMPEQIRDKTQVYLLSKLLNKDPHRLIENFKQKGVYYG